MSFHPLRRHTVLALACCGLILGACSARNADLPPPRELTEEEKIVARFVEALGGEEALRAYSSATTKGTLDIAAMGVSGDMTVFQMAPDKSLMKMIIPGFGETVEGYNGEIGWAEDAMQGARVNEGQILKDQARNARFSAELEYHDTYPEQQAAGETEWNGQAAYQLDLVDTDGNESSHYFAKDTGLLIGVETTQTSELGTADITISSSDYKEFGGVMVPTQIVIGVMGMEMIQTVESVTWDDVDPGVFEPSDSIKALLPE
jgi:hypothetical protein